MVNASFRTQCRNTEILRRRFQGRIQLWDSMETKRKAADQPAIDWICGAGLTNWLEQQLGNDKDQWGLETLKKQKFEVNEQWRESLLETLRNQPKVRRKRVQRRNQCGPCEKLSMRAFVAVASESRSHRNRSMPATLRSLPSATPQTSSRQRSRSLQHM